MKRIFLYSLLLCPAAHATEKGDEGILVHDADQSEIIAVGQRGWASYKSQLTSPANILSPDTIKDMGKSYVADLLKAVPGLSVSKSGAPGNLTQIRIRGAEANHTLVMIDGVEVSNPATGEFDFAALSAMDIYKIEVLRGEQSALYGSDAIGGVINIFTTAGDAPGTVDKWVKGPSFSVRGGSFGTLEAAVHANIDILSDGSKNWYQQPVLSVGFRTAHTGGYDISGLDIEDDGSASTSLRAALNRLSIGSIKVYTAGSWSQTRAEFDSDTDFNGRLDSTSDVLITEALSGHITGAFDLGVLAAEPISHTLSLSYTDTDTQNPYAAFKNDTIGTRYKAGWTAHVKMKDRHNLTALAEWEQEGFTQFGGSGALQNQSQHMDQGALGFEYRFEGDGPYVVNNTVISASLRQDFNSRFKNAVTWRAGANVALDGKAEHRLRASAGKGVKNPSMTEIFGFFPSSFIGNPGIKPETSLGFNLGYGWNTNTFGLNIDYFRSELDDEIITDFSVFPNTARNLRTKSKREGVEIEGYWAPIDNLKFKGSLTFLDTKENDVPELRRPGFTAHGIATWYPCDDLAVTLSLDHTGSQYDTDFATFGRVKLPAFTLIEANLRYQLNDVISLSVRGDNLLDEDYREVVGYTPQGRGVYAGLSADF